MSEKVKVNCCYFCPYFDKLNTHCIAHYSSFDNCRFNVYVTNKGSSNEYYTFEPKTIRPEELYGNN